MGAPGGHGASDANEIREGLRSQPSPLPTICPAHEGVQRRPVEISVVCSLAVVAQVQTIALLFLGHA